MRTVPFLLVFALSGSVFCSQAALAAAAADAGVSVHTAKQSYKQGEPVEVILENHSGVRISCLAAGPSPELCIRNFEVKNPRGIWDAYFLPARLSGADEDFEQASEIASGAVAKFSWVPRVLVQGKQLSPGPGLYRLSVIYHIRKGTGLKEWVFGTAKSNEFRIE